MDYLDAKFVTYMCDHSICSKCEPRLKKRCAACRFDNSAHDNKQDPWMLAAVLTLPRLMSCGVSVVGLDVADSHRKTCVRCMVIRYEELEKECNSHKEAHQRLESENTELATIINTTRDQVEEYKEGYTEIKEMYDNEVRKTKQLILRQRQAYNLRKGLNVQIINLKRKVDALENPVNAMNADDSDSTTTDEEEGQGSPKLPRIAQSPIPVTD